MKKSILFSVLAVGATLLQAQSITVHQTCGQNGQVLVIETNGHECVDLSLPSGTLWATCNVGATTPEDYGNYYAWGETSTKETYNWSTYFDTNDGGDTFIKYKNEGGKTVLDLEDDAAHVNWGGSWRMPTQTEWQELYDNCTWTWTTQNGVNGYKVTSNKAGFTDKFIFLPAAGGRYDGDLNGVGSDGCYWSSSLAENNGAWCLYFNSGSLYLYGVYGTRDGGISVRPVQDDRSAAAAQAVDLGLSVKWANMNVGAESPEDYGNYYAWGETSTKETYNWSTYFDTNDGGNTFTKYNIHGGKTVLDPEDDAAHVNWGGSWRMPTQTEWQELYDNCTWTWTTQNGVNGYKVTSNKAGFTDKFIFLPAAACRYDGDLNFVGSLGRYWSSSLIESGSLIAWILYFESDYRRLANFGDRYCGQSVRPVLQPSSISYSLSANDTIRIYSNGCDDYQTFIGSHGTQLTMTAQSDQWSHFVRWNDGNTDNPRTITTNGNADYTAYFEIEPIAGNYTIYYVDKESQDLSDEVVTLHVPVVPTISGFTFVGWQTVSTMLTDGITLQAVYQADAPSSAPAVYTNPSNPAQKLIRNGNVYILTDDKTYTVTGQQVK